MGGSLEVAHPEELWWGRAWLEPGRHGLSTATTRTGRQLASQIAAGAARSGGAASLEGVKQIARWSDKQRLVEYRQDARTVRGWRSCIFYWLRRSH